MMPEVMLYLYIKNLTNFSIKERWQYDYRFEIN
jgi:hypothetical protein